MKTAGVIFGLCAACLVARASINLDTDELTRFEREQEERVHAIHDREATLTKIVKQKSRTYHSITNNAGTASYVWADDPQSTDRNRRLERLLQVSIREDLKEIETLESQEQDLNAEIELTKLRLREALTAPEPKAVTVAKSGAFRCVDSPLGPAVGKTVDIIQDFGTRKDSETGIEWRSLGWWLGSSGREVRACATGTVAFTGKVPGRGRVVVLDHGDGGMTLYANLNDDPQLNFRKGETVKAGRILGTPRDKLYFEARRNGAAVNPREVLSSNTLSQIGL